MSSVKECILLAGGLGTRLRSAVPDLPKTLAPIAQFPFLHYILQYLQQQGIQRFVFALGYKSEMITSYLKSPQSPLALFPSQVEFVYEESPLGTGGAIQNALKKCISNDVLIVNSDTFFDISLSDLSQFHFQKKAACTLALKPMIDFDRYGRVEIAENGEIIQFREKQYYAKGLINGGFYILNRARFINTSFPEQFSFEKDYLEKNIKSNALFGLPMDGYFIDIGIPTDYNKAQTELLKYK